MDVILAHPFYSYKEDGNLLIIIYYIENITADAKIAQNNDRIARKFLSRKLGIAAGTDAAAGTYPYAVWLTINPAATPTYCGGTLFAYNLVITTGMFQCIKYIGA
jgi:hypothetical protein